MREFRVRPLSAERIAQAYPLVQTALPKVTPAAWRGFAAALISGADHRESGILVAIDAHDYIAGLCSYRVVPDLVHGRLFDTDNFVAFDLFDRRPVAEALAKAVETLARKRGCGAVHTHLPLRNATPPQPGNDLAELLGARGHRIESLDLCKRLTA